MCVTWTIQVWHDAYVCAMPNYVVTWLMHARDMTHSYVWHDSFLCDTWIIHKCDMTHTRLCYDFVRRDSFLCDMTTSYIWHDLFVCVTRLIMCDMTHSHVCHDSFMYTHILHQIFFFFPGSRPCITTGYPFMWTSLHSRRWGFFFNQKIYEYEYGYMSMNMFFL